jgi:hypothetical protein
MHPRSATFEWSGNPTSKVARSQIAWPAGSLRNCEEFPHRYDGATEINGVSNHSFCIGTVISEPSVVRHCGWQVGFDPLPLLVAQPKQIPAHDPNPSPKRISIVLSARSRSRSWRRGSGCSEAASYLPNIAAKARSCSRCSSFSFLVSPSRSALKISV